MRYHSLWRDLTKARLFLFYLLHFTILFIIVQFFVFKDFYIGGKSFIQQLDGFANNYSAMVNNSSSLRRVFSSENGFDFSAIPVRQGMYFSVFSFIASLFPMESQEFVYDLLIILKIYLAGCTFSLLGFYFRQKPLPVMIGSINYAFCGFSLLFCLRQPNFYDALIIMPLFLIGTEIILKGKRSLLFIILVFLALGSDIYLSYSYALLIVIYFLVRYFISYNDHTAKSFFKAFGRLVLSGSTGILLSGLFILPFAYMITHMAGARIGRNVPDLLFYPVDYYLSFISDYTLTISENLNEGSLGFSVIAVPCIITLFTERKKNTLLKILFILLSAMLLIPLFGYVFSGFNNIINRWCFAYALCVSAVVMFAVPSFAEMPMKKKAAVLAGTLVWGIASFLLSGQNQNLVLIVFLIIFMSADLTAGLLLKTRPETVKKVSLTIIMISACISPVIGRSFRHSDLSSFLDNGSAIELINNGQYASLAKSNTVINDKDVYYRVNGSSIFWHTMSSSRAFGLNGTSYYSSFYYPEYMAFLNELEMTQRGAMNYSLGLDARAVPLTLAGVKYHAARVSDSPVYPYGFTEIDRIENGKNNDVILKNDHYLPIGFTYDSYISKAAFESLSPIDKQDIMCRSVYLENTPSRLTENKDQLLSAKKLDYRITGSDGAEITGNTIRVDRQKAHITLEFDGIPGEETYIRFVDLKLTDKCENKELYLYTKADGKINHTRFLKEDYVYYGGYDNQILCLGSSKDGIKTCTIYFDNIGEYLIGEIQIWSHNMSEYAELMEKLRAESLYDVTVTGNGFSGKIKASSDRFLCFTLPYDAGWNCYVDGKKSEIVKANIGFMGIELPEGEHQIQMVYHMPLLKEGLIMSIAGFILLIVVATTDRLKSKAVHSDK